MPSTAAFVTERQMDLRGPAHRFGGLAERLGRRTPPTLCAFSYVRFQTWTVSATIEPCGARNRSEQAGTKIRNHDVALLRGALRTPRDAQVRGDRAVATDFAIAARSDERAQTFARTTACTSRLGKSSATDEGTRLAAG